MRSGFLVEDLADSCQISVQEDSSKYNIDFHHILKSLIWHPFAGGYLRISAKRYRTPFLVATFPVPKLSADGRPVGITCLQDNRVSHILEIPPKPEEKKYSNKLGIFTTLKYVKRVEGWRGILRGLGPTLLRLSLQEAAAAVALPTLNAKLDQFLEDRRISDFGPKTQICIKASCRAAITVLVKDLFLYPLHVVATRDLIFESLEWISSYDILNITIREDGWKAMVAGITPYLVARFIEEITEEIFKELISRTQAGEKKMRYFLAQPLASLCCHPALHVLYRRSEIGRCVSTIPGLCNSNYPFRFPTKILSFR